MSTGTVGGSSNIPSEKYIRGGFSARLKRGKNMTKKAKDALIKSEIEELETITATIPADARTYADRLINQAAFMYATLQELQEILNKDGAIEKFEQGVQKMLREHPASKTYNTMIKNYIACIKQLSDMTPQGETEDKLKVFLEKKKK